MRKPFATPSGTRVDRYTGEHIGMPHTTKSGKIRLFEPHLQYLYSWSIDVDSLPNSVPRLRELCQDALDLEEAVRPAAFQEDVGPNVKLEVFSLKLASDQFNLDTTPQTEIDFFHAVTEKYEFENHDILKVAQNLKSAVEAARGYQLGGRVLEAYQRLISDCGSFFLISGEIQVSDASPGLFD